MTLVLGANLLQTNKRCSQMLLHHDKSLPEREVDMQSSASLAWVIASLNDSPWMFPDKVWQGEGGVSYGRG